MIRVLLADDEGMIRAGIAAILNSDNDIEVVAEATTGREAVEETRKHRPDVALLDVQMPELDGLHALAEIRRTAPDTKVVILTTFNEGEYVAAHRPPRDHPAGQRHGARRQSRGAHPKAHRAGTRRAAARGRRTIMQRLGARNRVQAAITAHEAGLVIP